MASAEPFFPLASVDAKSVRQCRFSASVFDTNRTLAQALKVVKACEAEGYGNPDDNCRMYAVRVASAAQKFAGQLRAIESNNPGWRAMGDNVRYHRAEAGKYAPKCRR
jgi:hypothetical protein